MNEPLRIAFAGDRDISVWVLKFLLEQGVQPEALLISATKHASHADELIALCPFLSSDKILKGASFRKDAGRELLQQLNLDYVISIHFPYIVPQNVLSIPRYGILNLHPAYLPYNRGWHTPTWAILDDTPIGATLHFMDADVDTGDILHQKIVHITPHDTANSLYQRVKQCAFTTFKEAWPQIQNNNYQRQKQSPNDGTSHKRQNLFTDAVQKINLDQPTTAKQLIQQLRALTTNDINEAAFYEVDGKRYRIQVTIHQEESSIDDS